MVTLAELRSRLRSPATVAGLCVTLLPEGQLRCDLCVLQRRGNLVTVQARHAALPTVEAVAAQLPDKHVPVALVLAGRGLLLRPLPLETTRSGADRHWVAGLLPGANPADFYAQHVAGATSAYAALIRRSTTDGLLTQLQELGLSVIDLNLGPLPLHAVAPFVQQPADVNVLTIGGYEVVIRDGALASVSGQSEGEPVTETVRIGEENLPAAEVLPYAAALRVLLQAPLNEAQVAAVQVARQEWQHRRWFRVGLWSVLLTLLVGLLGNFLAFSQLSTESQQLSETTAANEAALRRLAALRRTVGQQQAFLESAGWLRSTQASVYADQLAASVPAQLQLLTLDIYPHDPRASSTQRQAVFHPRQLRVKGQCRDAQALNIWLQRLNQLPWVQAVREQNFSYDYAGRSGTFTFTIHLAGAGHD